MKKFKTIANALCSFNGAYSLWGEQIDNNRTDGGYNRKGVNTRGKVSCHC